jgi:6-pyruvoyltetrahydropterin/6-carboxytetrahydropterin synthase
MLELSRTVRFCLNDPPGDPPPRDNTFAAWPSMRGLGRYYELAVTCLGEADPKTGYFINIKHIDRAVHERAMPCMQRALAGTSASANVPLGQLMRDMLNALQPTLQGSVIRAQLRLTPTYRIDIRSHDMDHVLIRQRYEFSAAHRLHVPGMTDDKNRETFGKCNNPAGHGHNYRLEAAVRLPIDPQGRTANAEHIDAIVNRHAIEPLDHKHLNTDVPQFADLNPSVENIVKVIWNMLAGRFAELDPDAALEEISVWETSKTVCTYRGN